MMGKKKDEKERKLKQKERFKQLYDKPKVFKFPEKVNMGKHFYFPKFLDDGDWKLNKAALAIYPVICSRSDYNKTNWVQMNQNEIATMSGISKSQVREGIKSLTKRKHFFDTESGRIPLFEMNEYQKDQRRLREYRACFVRKDMMDEWIGSYFIFHTCIIDSQVWAKLSPRAKAFYLALRTKSWFNIVEYMENELGIFELHEYDEDIRGEFYRNRKYDECGSVTQRELCRIVHIEHTSLKQVIQQLEKHGLIEHFGKNFFKVHLKPKINIKDDF